MEGLFVVEELAMLALCPSTMWVVLDIVQHLRQLAVEREDAVVVVVLPQGWHQDYRALCCLRFVRRAGALDQVLAADAFVVFDAADGFGDEVGDGDLLDLGAAVAVGDGVGEDNLLELAVLHALAGGAAHDAVAGDGAHAAGTVLDHQVGGLGDGAGGIDHVIYEDDVGILHIADNLHAGDFVGTGTCLVAEHEGATEVLGVGGGAFGTAHVGGGDDEVLEIEALHVGEQDAGGVEVIHGDVEEALLLVGVQVHGDEAADAGHGEHVCHEFGADGHAGLVLAVLTCPSEIGDDGVDAAGGGALGGVDHQQELHEVVAVGEGALHEEDIATADALFVADAEFAVGEVCDVDLALGHAQAFADFLGEVLCGCAGKDKEGGHGEEGLWLRVYG